MQLKVYCPLWGTDESQPVEQHLERAAAVGFGRLGSLPVAHETYLRRHLLFIPWDTADYLSRGPMTANLGLRGTGR